MTSEGDIIEVKIPLKVFLFEKNHYSGLISDNCADRIRASEHLLVVICMKSGAINAFSRYNMKRVIEIKGNPEAASIFWSGESVAIIDHSGVKIDQSYLFIT